MTAGKKQAPKPKRAKRTLSAALNAPMLRKWTPPEGCDEVAVFGDNDAGFAGQAAAYDAAMDARDAAMNDPENTRPVLTPVDDIPSAFMGDALNADNLDDVLSLYAEYYEKQQVTAAEGGIACSWKERTR